MILCCMMIYCIILLYYMFCNLLYIMNILWNGLKGWRTPADFVGWAHLHYQFWKNNPQSFVKPCLLRKPQARCLGGRRHARRTCFIIDFPETSLFAMFHHTWSTKSKPFKVQKDGEVHGFSLKIPEFPMEILEIITIFPSQKGQIFDAWLSYHQYPPIKRPTTSLPEQLFGPLLNR